MNEQRIWLIDMGDGDRDWCDSPDPSDGIDPEDVTGPYVLGADDRIAELQEENERMREQTERQARQIIRLRTDLREAINSAAIEGQK